MPRGVDLLKSGFYIPCTWAFADARERRSMKSVTGKPRTRAAT